MDDVTLLTLVGTFASVIALIWAVFVFIAPAMRNRREETIRAEKISLGPYDKRLIEEAGKYYIKPKCSLNDPTHEYTRNKLSNGKSIKDLFLETEKFIAGDEYNKYLLVLADSGMGKTTYILNFFSYNKKLPKRQRHKIALISLSIPAAESWINKIDRPEDTVVFLDAFDEDTKAINNHNERMQELLKLGQNFKKLIITCRSQFFPSEEDIPRETNIPRIGPVFAGSSKKYQIQRLYLLPFTSDDVRRYVDKRYKRFSQEQKDRALNAISKIPSLSMRPMILAYIPELLKNSSDATYSYELFELMVEGWLERESAWVDKHSLRTFSEKLAVNIYNNRKSRGAERISKDELHTLSLKWGLNIEKWKLTGRSLLNRDVHNYYKFSHRSIMEYLYVVRIISGDVDCLNTELTDQMTVFISEIYKFNKTVRQLVGNNPRVSSLNFLRSYTEAAKDSSREIHDQNNNVFNGIEWIGRIGVILKELNARNDLRQKNITKIGYEFDLVFERKGLGVLTLNKKLIEAAGEPQTINKKLLESVSKSKVLLSADYANQLGTISSLIAKDIDVPEQLIRNILLYKSFDQAFMSHASSFLGKFAPGPNDSILLKLLNANEVLSKSNLLIIPVFDKTNFSHFTILFT